MYNDLISRKNWFDVHCSRLPNVSAQQKKQNSGKRAYFDQNGHETHKKTADENDRYWWFIASAVSRALTRVVSELAFLDVGQYYLIVFCRWFCPGASAAVDTRTRWYLVSRTQRDSDSNAHDVRLNVCDCWSGKHIDNTTEVNDYKNKQQSFTNLS